MNKKRRQKTSSSSFNLAQWESKPYFLPMLGLCGLLMGILLFDANLSLTGDNAQFINLGRSLAEGYGLSETIEGEPIPHTKYPFGFPLLLAIIDILFPDNLIALKSLVVVLYAISIPLTYLLIRRFAPPPMALGTSALCLASPLLLDYSHQVMSEIPFLLFSFIALLLLHRAQKSNTLSTLALAIIAIIAAYYIRSAGIILIGTGIHLFCPAQKMERRGTHRHRQFSPRPALSNPQRIARRHPLHQTTPQHKPLPPGRRHPHIHHPHRTHHRKSRTLWPANHPPHLSTQFYRHQLFCRPLLLLPDPLRAHRGNCETQLTHRVPHLLSDPLHPLA